MCFEVVQSKPQGRFVTRSVRGELAVWIGSKGEETVSDGAVGILKLRQGCLRYGRCQWLWGVTGQLYT